MSPDLNHDAIAEVDPKGMLGDVLGQPEQLRDALWRLESAALRPVDAPGGLTVCGMGGSAIGGDLAAAAIGPRAARPIQTVRDYSLPPWLGAGTLVLCSSYSGDTEETLACFERAGESGASRVALTTGGALADAARAADVPVVGVPAGFQPRAAVAYMTVGALECAALCGAATSLRSEVEAAGTQLEGLAAEWGPDAPEDSAAKALAGRLEDGVVVVYGAQLTEPVARRWKTQLNENPGRAAFHAPLPEADHNEVCAWGDLAAAGRPATAVFLEDRDQHPRTRRRIELTADLIAADGGRVERIATSGDTAFERLMSLVFLGDLVSVYLAALRGVDPTPVEPIERLKRELG
jgi:glucose/mannose-6-phosphate isomerase